MNLLLRIFQVALVATAVFNVWGTLGMMLSDGTAEMIRDMRDNGPHLLPGTNEPLRRFYTGIGPVDAQLTILCVFFWSIIDGSHPEYKLHIFDFAFRFAVQYGICLIEGSRPGNAGRWVSNIVLWGALMQNLGVANTLPIYALVYIRSSPTVENPTIPTILPATAELISLPISLILGYFIPIALMSSPAISTDGQQIWLGVWQFFPLWVTLLQKLLPAIISPYIEKGAPAEEVQIKIQSLRSVYTVLRYLSIVGHLFSWAVSLKTFEAPEIFAYGIPQSLHPVKVWLPAAIWPSFRVRDIGSGAHLFLQYDRIGCSIAGLLFSYYLYIRTRGKGSVASHASEALKVLLLACFTGPAGAAVSLMEWRDEAVFAKYGTSVKKAD